MPHRLASDHGMSDALIYFSGTVVLFPPRISYIDGAEMTGVQYHQVRLAWPHRC